jgi:hypothetical protein
MFRGCGGGVARSRGTAHHVPMNEKPIARKGARARNSRTKISSPLGRSRREKYDASRNARDSNRLKNHYPCPFTNRASGRTNRPRLPGPGGLP